MTAQAVQSARALPDDEARRIVELASGAPSVHNTQPWSWRVNGNDLELYADMARRLPVEDPSGRNAVVSCGAALHHCQVAARALGWKPLTIHLPFGSDKTLLARITLVPTTPSPEDVAALEALEARRTDRRRFTSWPVPDGRLHRLALTATARGCHAVPLLESTTRFRLDLIMDRARSAQQINSAAIREQGSWIDRTQVDGIPAALVPADPSDRDPNGRFGSGVMDEPEVEIERSDGVIVLAGATDDAEAWLRTGEGLSALWLEATGEGLSVVPLSQPIEVEPTRLALGREVLGGLLVPHLLVRVGWQAIGRSQLPRSPRRPVDDVLRS